MRITALFVVVLVAMAALFSAAEADPTFFKNKGGQYGGGQYGGPYGGGGKNGGGKGGGKLGGLGGRGLFFPFFGGLFGKKG
ncbi:ctenidin-3-like [Penaeus japonicus]|uniref:ctenidin-3-like n=1 Tax=Penaeus japonicus TaxID=27405 RepID=UPI001C7102C4|nr:ctenidin-3-like [Penaeus japonicus]